MQIVMIRQKGGVRFELTVRSLDGPTNTLLSDRRAQCQHAVEHVADVLATVLADEQTILTAEPGR
jgi:hypothetical protein